VLHIKVVILSEAQRAESKDPNTMSSPLLHMLF
jgi:hypothetical protein